MMLPIIVLLCFFCISYGCCGGNILVAMSSAGSIELTNNITHPTGFYLDEAYFPINRLISNGYNVYFANPLGNTPPIDPISLQPKYFNNNPNLVKTALQFLNQTSNFINPFPYEQILQDIGSFEFESILIPGGHAPMVDLYNNQALGEILTYFYNHNKPIGAICHGPVALMSTKLLHNNPWIFTNATLTVYTDSADKKNELLWGGNLPFLPQQALKSSGANVVASINPQESFVTMDGLLITAENPYSGEQFSIAYVDFLLEYSNSAKF